MSTDKPTTTLELSHEGTKVQMSYVAGSASRGQVHRTLLHLAQLFAPGRHKATIDPDTFPAILLCGACGGEVRQRETGKVHVHIGNTQYREIRLACDQCNARFLFAYNRVPADESPKANDTPR